MSGANLAAVDRVVRIVRELDGYHGFETAAPTKPKPRKLASQRPLALTGPESGRTQMAPQPIEKSRFADMNGNIRPDLMEVEVALG